MRGAVALVDSSYDTAAVQRALAGFSVVRQGAVIRTLRHVDADTARVVADAGLDGEIATYLGRTGRAGADLVNDLDDAAVRALLASDNPGLQRHLVRSWDSDADVDVDVVGDVARTYDALGPSSQRRFTAVLDRSGEAGVRFAHASDPGDLEEFLDLARPRRGPDDTVVQTTDVESLGRFAARTGDDGAAFVRGVDETTLQRLFELDTDDADLLRSGLATAWRQSDDLTDAHLQRAAARYADLDPADQRAFTSLSNEPDLQVSWTRTVGAAGLDQESVPTAIHRFEKLEFDDGHDVKEFKTGREANEHPFHEGNQPPHKEDGIVIEFEIDSSDEFVRIHSDPGNAGGRWMMKEESFGDVATREDALNKFGLSEDWGEYDRMAAVELDEEARGLRIQVSAAGKIEDATAGVTRKGGGTQYFVKPPQRVDGWEDIGSLNDFLTGIA